MNENSNEKPFVLVTTQWRGVFAGYLEDDRDTVVELSNVRCAIDWMTKGGFLELADIGPNERSKIGNPAPRAKLQGITGTWYCTDAAKEAWLNHGK